MQGRKITTILGIDLAWGTRMPDAVARIDFSEPVDKEYNLLAPLSKRYEDILDAYVCALIGLWHVAFNGTRSQILGDLQSGHMMIPTS